MDRLALLFMLAMLAVVGACAADDGARGDDSALVADANEQDVMVASVHGKLDRALGGQDNDYVVRHVRIQDGFAFLAAEVRGKERALDWARTSFYPEIQGGSFALLDTERAPREAASFSVLLQRTSTSAKTGAGDAAPPRWLVIDLVVGAPDGALAGDGYEGAPRAIFPAK